MPSTDSRTFAALVSASARGFGLIVLAVPVGVSHEYSAIVSVTLLGAIWLGAVFVESLPRLEFRVATIVEASLVAVVATMALSESAVLLPALTIPVFTAGLRRGIRGALAVLETETAVFVALVLLDSHINPSWTLIGQYISWLIAGLGMGAIASLYHASRPSVLAVDSSYRDARALLIQLRDLSGDLTGGLDPVHISEGIIDLAREELPLTGAVVYAEGTSGYVPLIGGDTNDNGTDNTEVLDEVFATGKPVLALPWVGIPLVTDAGIVAVMTAGVLPFAQKQTQALKATMDRLVDTLRAEALQLDTAMLFSSLRDIATVEERRRLARELHDGVAQDLASFGYLIDEMTDTADEAQHEEVVELGQQLRKELSRVIAELRRSIFELRNDASSAESLGANVRALASHIEARSGVTVKVRTDEGSMRLRPDVEAELLRIAQEGMNNAVKHAQARSIEVHLEVQAPAASVRVVDDGVGLQTGRDDSHGIRIMRERARRIGATLDLYNTGTRPGTTLLVTLSATSRTQ